MLMLLLLQSNSACPLSGTKRIATPLPAVKSYLCCCHCCWLLCCCGAHLNITVDAPMRVHIVEPLQHILHDGGDHHLVQALTEAAAAAAAVLTSSPAAN